MAGNTFNETGRDAVAITVRFPAGVSERLRETARLSRRSMNAEIIARLEASLEAKQQIAPAIADLLEQHIQNEVTARLQAIAAKIGGSA